LNERVGGPAALVLTATVARRYYIDGETKSDIAAQLGLSRFKVARLLEQARAAGVVRIELDSPGEINLDLSVRLRTAYGLRHCVVIDGPEDDDELLRAALGRAAADLLTEIVEPGDVLGLVWARSLMSIPTSLRGRAHVEYADRVVHADVRALRRAVLGRQQHRPLHPQSLLAAGISTVIAVVLGCLAGYGLARSRFRGKDHVAFWIISQRMAPIAAVVLPLFVIFRFTGLLGSTWGLIVAYLTFNLPFAIWIMNAFFSQLNPSLEEAALIDGATRWSTFRE
jgi:hypothetical protein